MRMDFGDRFAYKDGDAHPGKSSEGEENGQENFEEVEEDPSNEAADGARLQEVGPSSIGPSALRDGVRPGNSDMNGKRGHCPKGSGPFLRLLRLGPCESVSFLFPPFESGVN